MSEPVIVRRRTQGPDPVFTLLAVGLGTVGLILSASARVYREALATGTPVGLFRSLVHLALALLFMAATMIPDYRWLTRSRVVWAMLVGMSALLVAALLGPEVQNTHRWLALGGFRFQPSELAKPVLVLALAATIVRAGPELRTVAGLARPVTIGAWLAGLVLVGKDLGTPALLFGVTIALVIGAGARWKHTGSLIGSAAAMFALFAWLEPYRVKRLVGFTHALNFSPHNLTAIPYQLAQSLVALGSGGVLGKGFGLGTSKALFLPEADNDFIYATIGEELGLWGALLVLVAFLVLAWRGMRAAERAPDEVGKQIILGATWLLAGQALCHMGVVTGLLPTKGLPLPFLSTGGSSLMASFALVGLVLNVSIRSRDNA